MITSRHLNAAPGRSSRAPARAVASAVVAAALVIPLGAVTAGTAIAAPEPGSFWSSFEAGDPAPLESTVAQRDGAPWQANVTGNTLMPGSILPRLKAVTARGQNAPGEVAANLADGNPSTKWLDFLVPSAANPTWVRYELNAPSVLSGYALTSANDAAERDPKDWTIDGSNDGTTWTTVDTRTGETFAGRHTTNTYRLATPSPAYAFYRLHITKDAGAGNSTQLADWDLSADLDAAVPATPFVTALGKGPASGPTIKANVGWDGVQALKYAGSHPAAGPAEAWNVLYQELSVPVAATSRLTYTIFPDMQGSDLTYPSTYAAVDLRFTDGTYLSELGATESHSVPFSPLGEGAGKILYANQWNMVQVDLTKAAGKTIQAVLLGYENPTGKAGTKFSGWVDSIKVDPAPAAIDPASRLNYVDTRRGTNSSGSFSRGNNIPATAMPNGFNFLVPMTNATSSSWEYEYQSRNNAKNLPVLEGLGISHEPSPWMGDRNQISFMPMAGTNLTAVPNASIDTRKLEFSHADETARPDYYGVTFSNGIKAEFTPTDHGAVYRFTYAGDVGVVLADLVSGTSKFSFDADGHLTGWVENGSGLSAGRTRMYVAGALDRTPNTVGNATSRTSARFATFDTATDKTVELRVATSFIGVDQAKNNLALEVTDQSFDAVRAAAAKAWTDRLKVVDVQGATQDQLVTLYSNLYRLNLYPNSQFENTGTAAAPKFQYASPVSATTGSATDTATNAKIVDGKIYVNNGFWDTYRTVWSAYSLLYPDFAGELVDGFVQHYRDGGWIARWSSPGYADLMTGTSSDVAFADAYLKGADLPDAAGTYAAALKNATVAPTSSAVGRKGLDRSIFLGYTASSTGESVSWGLEGLINDFGIGNMAAKLAEDPATPAARRAQLRDESRYFLQRARNFVNQFNPEVDFFTARNADGSWGVNAATFDPKAWGGAYTEASGWNFAFHAPQDPQGLANLYGGKKGLQNKLDEFFSTPETAAHSGIHEAYEARDVRLGQLGQSNQVSHHIPYMYVAAGVPAKSQAIIREIMARLYVGSEIGQGYPGDEDNGETSGWYVLSMLGIYPFQVGSDQWTIGSPLFTKATVHLPAGDLVVNAANNSPKNVYVQSMKVNGVARTSTTISTNDVRAGTTIDFVMGAAASTWGTGAKDALPSLTTGDQVPAPWQDATTSGLGTISTADGTAAGALVDNTSGTRVTFPTQTPVITWRGAGIRPTAHAYTLTSGASGTARPTAWKLEGSADGKTWTTLDERTGQVFDYPLQTRPFILAEAAVVAQVRLSVTAWSGAGSPSLAEIELLADPRATGGTDLTLTPADHQSAIAGKAYTGTFATMAGLTGDVAAYPAKVTFGDGTAAVAATAKALPFGGYALSATHTWAAPGVYPVTVTVTAKGRTVSATTYVTVSLQRDGTLLAAYNNVCIGAVGASYGNCDALTTSIDRAQLAAKGFVQGSRGTVPGTELKFDLPAVAPGAPDNMTFEGQTVSLEVPADAQHLSVIATATEKNQAATGTLTFDDGSTTPITLSFGDWTGTATSPAYGNIPVAVTDNRLVGGSPTSQKAAVFASAPLALPEGKRVVSLTVPAQSGTLRDGRIHLFAVAHDGTFVDVPALSVTAEPGLTAVEQTDATFRLATVAGGRAADASGYRASISWGDGSDAEPAAVVAGGDGLEVGGTHWFAAAGTYTAHVTVDDGWTSVTVPVTIVVRPQPVRLEVAATAQCLAGKVYLSISATNTAGVPADIELRTAYGTKTVRGVAPGKVTSQAFNTRLAAMPAGTATVVATATVDGKVVTATYTVPYASSTCR